MQKILHNSATFSHGFFNHSLGYVKTYKHTADFVAAESHLQAGVVPFVLIPERCLTLDYFDDIINCHTQQIYGISMTYKN